MENNESNIWQVRFKILNRNFMAKAIYSAALSGEKKSGGGLEFSVEFTIDDKTFTSDGKKNNDIALSAIKTQNPGIMSQNNLSKLVCRGYSKVRDINTVNNTEMKEKKGLFGKLMSIKSTLDKISDSIVD